MNFKPQLKFKSQLNRITNDSFGPALKVSYHFRDENAICLEIIL